MKHPVHPILSRCAIGVAIFALTAVSYAQWSTSGRRCSGLSPLRPAEGERSAADSLRRPVEGREFPLSLAGARLPAGGQDRERALPACPATAAATAPWATPACAVAMRMRTAPSAPSAPRRFFRLPSRRSWARPRPRFAPPSPGTSTRASTWRSSRSAAETGIQRRIRTAARASWPGSHPSAFRSSEGLPLKVGASRFRRDRLRLRRHVRVWAPVIACKTKVANDNLALAA